MPDWTVVPGKNAGDIRLYALSTCGHCKRVRELLKELGVSYRYIYADLLPDDEAQAVYLEAMTFNPRGSFPTLVVNETVIVGDRVAEIREAVQP